MGNKLFIYLTPEETASKNSCEFSHIGWEGKGPLAFCLLADNYKNAADILFDKMTKANGKFSIVDSLTYPLCFLYRHSLEIFLKYLYLKYSGCDEEGFKAYLNKAQHNLSKSWLEVKPFLSKGKKKFGTKANIGLIEDYVKEMQDFDQESMRMRYPISKNLEPQHPTAIRLDIYNFHNCIEELFHHLKQIDYDIDKDKEVSFEYSDVEIKEYRNNYVSAKNKVEEYIRLIEPFVEKENDIIMHSLDDFINKKPFQKGEKGYKASLDYMNTLSPNEIIIIETLYYTGRHLNEELIHLSINKDEGKKEFIKMCLYHMKLNGLKFDSEIDETKINAFGKASYSIVQNLNKAIEILG